MRLGVTETIDCAHMLPGHPICGQLHGHTYTVEVVVEGETRDGMVVDFADLRSRIRQVLAPYDHRNWNDVLDNPTVENICERVAGQLSETLGFAFTLRIYEGQGKWAETNGAPASGERAV